MLTNFILKCFVPHYKDGLTPEVRVRCGIVSGVVCIVCNLLLAAVKFSLALLTGSISAGADGVNNLSDAGTGLITIAGFRFSAREPDSEHPFGHGRSEYVAALVAALIIMGLGASFFKDSIIALFRRSEINCQPVMIVIFSATILVKCWLFLFYNKLAKVLNSGILKAAAYDSLSDCLGTSAVIGAMIASRYTRFPVDGAVGILVAGLILFTGGKVLKETVNKLLGEPPAPELVDKLRETILNCPGIDGIHDMIIHNYGENTYYVTAHAEISFEGDRFSAHDILENAEVEVAKVLPVHLLLHADPYNTNNTEVIYWRSRMENAASEFDRELKLYDFRLQKNDDDKVTGLSFHLLVPRRYSFSEKEITRILTEKMRRHQQDIELDIRFLKSFV